jgi:hypothetical protein
MVPTLPSVTGWEQPAVVHCATTQFTPVPLSPSTLAWSVSVDRAPAMPELETTTNALLPREAGDG